MAKWPLQQTRQVGKYTYTVSHNLPDLAMGQDLFPTNPAQNFDRLFSGQKAATTAQVASYAHVHHELMRYATDERLVLNPGSVGEPFNRQWDLQADTRAQYMLLAPLMTRSSQLPRTINEGLIWQKRSQTSLTPGPGIKRSPTNQ